MINEAGGIITITGTTSDAQISDILVGYELADGTEGALSGVTVVAMRRVASLFLCLLYKARFQTFRL